MPEKGQIKFMKTLLGKVKTLLHSDVDDGGSTKSKENVDAHKMPEKISAVATDAGTNKLYGVLGHSKGHKTDNEKSVNVISIPLEALKKVVPTASYLSRGKDSGDSAHMPKSPQIVLKPISVRLANNEENRGMSSLVPVVLQNQAPRVVPFRSDSYLPDGDNSEPYVASRLPFIIERHGDILKHNKADEKLFGDKKGDEGLYRDIGHIPGEIRFHNAPSEDRDEESRRPSLRHRNPVGYHHDRADDDDDDEDDEDDDDDDYDDDDDDEDDDYDDNYEKQIRYRDSPRMREEERQIAMTRKRLYDMLPGNDPTYTSENRGLGLPMRPGMMEMPEAFLGNPMIQPGVGINQQRTLMPFLGEAMAGEHADNSNERSVFMLGGHGTRQVFWDSGSDELNTPRQSASMRVNSGGFTLGGSHAQAMSPNEVSYMIQKQPGFGQLSEKDKIARPTKDKAGGVLLKVNGHPIGDSRELRDHVENGVLFKGKEKLIKSKGPVDVKVSKATDGVHSKVVDITSAERVKVLEAKSKIAKTH